MLLGLLFGILLDVSWRFSRTKMGKPSLGKSPQQFLGDHCNDNPTRSFGVIMISPGCFLRPLFFGYIQVSIGDKKKDKNSQSYFLSRPPSLAMSMFFWNKTSMCLHVLCVNFPKKWAPQPALGWNCRVIQVPNRATWIRGQVAQRLGASDLVTPILHRTYIYSYIFTHITI